MPTFRTLMELKLRNLIINIIKLGTRVPIYSLIKRPISKINDCSLY
jgi:hypothetical protein